MALELDCLGPSVYAAAEGLMNRRELVLMAGLLEAAPHTETTEALWRFVANPDRLDAELAVLPPDPEAVAILVGRLGLQAVNSLLDHLGRTDDRSTRATVMRQLLALGPRAGEVAVARLPEAPWYLQRDILVLIGRLGGWPTGSLPSATRPTPIRVSAARGSSSCSNRPLIRLRECSSAFATRMTASFCLRSGRRWNHVPPKRFPLSSGSR